MDDIQFWLYLAFGLIYFITRQMRKKKKAEEQGMPDNQEEQKPYKKPVSFEDLLKEFTGERDEEQKREILDEYAEDQQEEEEVEYRPLVSKQEKVEDDHSHRRFSDEESRQIYEKSIQQAEGADIEFKPDEHFKSKLKTRQEREEAGAKFRESILDSLQNADEAKKAVVLSEILNRKY